MGISRVIVFTLCVASLSGQSPENQLINGYGNIRLNQPFTGTKEFTKREDKPYIHFDRKKKEVVCGIEMSLSVTTLNGRVGAIVLISENLGGGSEKAPVDPEKFEAASSAWELLVATLKDQYGPWWFHDDNVLAELYFWGVSDYGSVRKRNTLDIHFCKPANASGSRIQIEIETPEYHQKMNRELSSGFK